MKKFAKVLLGTLAVCTMAVSFAACRPDDNTEEPEEPVAKTGTTYGLVHGAGYVGKATVTTTDGEITGATLEEVCFPTQVKAGDTVAEEDKVGDYYKTVKYGGVTLVYDAEADGGKGAYTVGEQTFVEYLQTEANCRAYFEAVVEDNVAVVVGGAESKTVMTNAALNKDENGYWTNTKDKEGNSYSRWKVNRDATINYVSEHGVEGLKNLVKSEEGVEDAYGVNAKYWKDSNGVSTGATWSDMFKDEAPENYFTYAQLLISAAEKAK